MQQLRVLVILVAIAVCGCTHNGGPVVKVTPVSNVAGVVDNLVAEISAIAKDYPELEGFEEKALSRQDQLHVLFECKVKRFSEMRLTRPDDVGENGIELVFLVHDESNPVWTTASNPGLHLKHMKKIVWSSLVLSPDASAGLQQKLAAILDKHKTLLQELDKGTANKALKATGGPAP